MDKVTIIIPVYNPKIPFLMETLRIIISHQAYLIDRIIIVDDGSPTPMVTYRDAVQRISKKISILRQLQKGPGGARNGGAKLAETNIVVFLDQDCRPEPQWLAELIKPILDQEAIGVMGKVATLPNRSPLALYADYIELLRFPSLDTHKKIRNLITANSAFDRQVFNQLGGFEERLTVAGEDLDLTYRLVNQGFQDRLHFANQAIVYHDHRTTLSGFYRQQWGYGYGTMYHCLLRQRPTSELGFDNPNIFLQLYYSIGYIGRSWRVLWQTPRAKYGLINKLIRFPLFEYVRQWARLRGHQRASKMFQTIQKEFDTVDRRRAAKLILRDDLGRYLILHKPAGDYAIPGGGVKPGEKMLDALRRECQEELRLDLSEVKYLHSIGTQTTFARINYQIEAEYYLGQVSEHIARTITLDQEHDELAWVSLADAPWPMNSLLSEILNATT